MFPCALPVKLSSTGDLMHSCSSQDVAFLAQHHPMNADFSRHAAQNDSESDSCMDSGTDSGLDSDSDSDSDQCVDVIWAKAARGVWGLAHLFNNKLFFIRDMRCSPQARSQNPHAGRSPTQLPSPRPQPTLATRGQEFRMVYHRKKGFILEPVEHQIIPCSLEGALQPS